MCCWALLVLIHTGASFRAIKLNTERTFRLLTLQANAAILTLAAEIDWEAPLNKLARIWPQNTSPIVHRNSRALQIFSSVLSQSVTLAHLWCGCKCSTARSNLINSDIGGLTLSGSNLIPGDVGKPSLSSVNHLRLEAPAPATRHTLFQLSGPVDKLTLISIYEFDANLPIRESA